MLATSVLVSSDIPNQLIPRKYRPELHSDGTRCHNRALTLIKVSCECNNLKSTFFFFFFNKGSKVLNHSNSMCSSCGLVIHCGSAVWHNYLLADEGVNKKFLVCVWS